MKYRKKPVVIEAFQFTIPLSDQMPHWLQDAVRTKAVTFHSGDPPHIEIHTLEGTMRGDLNDWIIRGVKGELYPCKPDIFEATYESAAAIPALDDTARERAKPLPGQAILDEAFSNGVRMGVDNDNA